eukprot:1138155-Prymnesium_polylepis.1
MSASGVAALVRHTGAGVARRDAYHERRSVDRAELEEVDVDIIKIRKKIRRNSFKIERTEGRGKNSKKTNEQIGSRASAGISQPLRRQPGVSR